MIVQYTANTDQCWLRTGSKYAVQAIFFDQGKGLCYRIISEDAATPVMFSASDFTMIDGSIPQSWRIHVHINGALEISPSAWLEPGFWEHYFDDDEDAKQVFALNASSIS